jgi:uncharacterized protein (DUF3820 family)
MPFEEDIVMPFGKHKGKTISECPVEYLDWLIGQDWMECRDLKADILKYLEGCPEWKRM